MSDSNGLRSGMAHKCACSKCIGRWPKTPQIKWIKLINYFQKTWVCLNSSVLFRTLWILPIIFTSFKRNSLRKDDPLFLGANYICSCYRLIFCPSNKVKCKTLKTTNVQEGMIFNFTCQKLLQTVNLELIWGSYTVDIRLRCPKVG